MVKIPDEVQSMFTGTVERQGDEYVVELPSDEIEYGTILPETVYRVALLNTPEQTPASGESSQQTEQPTREPTPRTQTQREQTPPVSEGEQRTVTVEAVGSEGDGIAKVERGYVVIVPGGKPGEELVVEIERVTQSVAFAKTIGAPTGDSDDQSPDKSETANDEMTTERQIGHDQ